MMGDRKVGKLLNMEGVVLLTPLINSVPISEGSAIKERFKKHDTRTRGRIARERIR
jgi:hypothetical protein